MIITESIESFNSSSGIFLVVEVHVGEAFAQSSVLVLGEIHLRLFAELVRELFQISIGSGLGEIGDANGGGVVAVSATSVLLLILDEGRHILAGFAGAQGLGRRR